MIRDQNEWDIEYWFYVHNFSLEPEMARSLVISRWMYNGDFRPLAAHIRESGGEVNKAVLGMLVQFIEEGRLKLTPNKRGRPKDPATSARRFVAALAYERDGSERSSDDKFADVADRFGMSEQTVRAAYTAWQKAQKKRSKESAL